MSGDGGKTGDIKTDGLIKIAHHYELRFGCLQAGQILVEILDEGLAGLDFSVSETECGILLLVSGIRSRSLFINDLIDRYKVNYATMAAVHGYRTPSAEGVLVLATETAIGLVDCQEQCASGLIKSIKRNWASGCRQFDALELRPKSIIQDRLDSILGYIKFDFGESDYVAREFLDDGADGD